MAANTEKRELIFDVRMLGLDKITRSGKVMAKQLRQTTKLMSGQAQQLISGVTATQKIADAHNSWSGVMGMSMENLKRVNEGGARFNSMSARMANQVRLMTHGLRGFRMEMLGVMFFGMGMLGLFSGLLKPSANLFGIFELWGILLEVTFLPVMSFLFDLFMKFFEWVLTWDEDTKMMVGTLVIFGLLLGGFIMLFGMLALGVGSSILAFGKYLAMTGKVSAVFIGIGLIVAGFVKLFQGKMEGLALILMGVGFILFAFIGWWALIPIAVGAAAYLIIKHWDRIKLFFKTLWIDIKIIFFKGLIGIATMFFNNALIKFIMDKLGYSGGVIGTIADKVNELETEKAFIKSQYEIEQALKETAETGKKTSNDMKGSVLGMLGTTKNANKGITNSYEESFGLTKTTVEGTMTTMAGGYKEKLGDMFDVTKVKVGDINSELSKIGSGIPSTGGGTHGLSTSGIYSDAFGKAMVDGRRATGDEIARDLGLHDFIWRPGQAPTKIDPGDSIIGTKGGSMGGGVTINQTNNINVSDKNEMERMIESNNRKIVDDLSRLTKAPI